MKELPKVELAVQRLWRRRVLSLRLAHDGVEGSVHCAAREAAKREVGREHRRAAGRVLEGIGIGLGKRAHPSGAGAHGGVESRKGRALAAAQPARFICVARGRVSVPHGAESVRHGHCSLLFLIEARAPRRQDLRKPLGSRTGRRGRADCFDEAQEVAVLGRERA